MYDGVEERVKRRGRVGSGGGRIGREWERK